MHLLCPLVAECAITRLSCNAAHTDLKGNSTDFPKCVYNPIIKMQQSKSEWFDVKRAIVEELTDLDFFTVVVMGVMMPSTQKPPVDLHVPS